MLQYWRRIGSKPILLLAIEQLAFNHLSSETFMWKHNTHNPGIGIVCWHCIVCWHSIFFYCCHNYSDKSLLLQLLQCCTSWDNSRLLPIPFLCQMTGDDNKETGQGERMVAFLFFFFVKQAIFAVVKINESEVKLKILYHKLLNQYII